jgi:ribosomal protein L11 methyltransferase
VQVCYLLSDEEQNEQHTNLIETALKWTGADHTILSAIDISEGEEIKPMNWQQAILDEYQEIMIADNLKIVPTWGETNDFPANANGSKTSGTSAANSAPMDPPTIIRLNPGIAFGTGDHPTTRMCLQWINTLRDSNVDSILDYGAGSGILAIAALILNVARSAIGTDIEPLAIKASTHNAMINSVGDRFNAQLIDEAQESQAPNGEEHTHDIIVANILQGPLTQLAPQLAAHAHRGTLLGLSGITSNQVQGIQKAYEDVGFRNFVTQTDDRDMAVTPMGHRWVVLTAVFGDAARGSSDSDDIIRR